MLALRKENYYNQGKRNVSGQAGRRDETVWELGIGTPIAHGLAGEDSLSEGEREPVSCLNVPFDKEAERERN